MKNILELNELDAKSFLLKKDSYSNIDLPYYFSFKKILNDLSKELSGKNLSDFRTTSPRNFEDVNYHLISNKDGQYAWRPYQLIHPALYVSLVHNITEKNNWNFIKNRFSVFQKEKRIECNSLPVVPESRKTTNIPAQIYNWWQMIEQQSMFLALDYNYVVHSDITDCYGSIYTHSISWALHTKTEAKKQNNRNNKSLIGVVIDNHLQDMTYGQTNGIPQGSVLMDLIAEIVLGYVDLKLAEQLSRLKIDDYKILRYRDDYRIFTIDSFEGEQITKELSEILSKMGLRLNPDKTKASDDIIKSSIKPDKRYWIRHRRIAENKQKWLIQLYLFSETYQNSGTIDVQMKEFLTTLEKSKRKDPNIKTLISLVTEICLRNPRVIPTAIAILSIFINRMGTESERSQITEKIKSKLSQVPNSSYIMVWFQRLYWGINKNEGFNVPLCNKVRDSKQIIWNTDWLQGVPKKIIDNTEIVKKTKLKTLKKTPSKAEIKKIVKKHVYY